MSRDIGWAEDCYEHIRFRTTPNNAET